MGEIVGILILVAIAVGLVRTFRNPDYSWRQKLFGIGKNAPRAKKGDPLFKDDEGW